MSMAPAPTENDVPETLRAGREAFARHAWREAFDQLAQADGVMTLDGADLESLAIAAFFSGHADVRIAIAERSFAAYQRAGDVIRAAYVDLEIAAAFMLRGKLSVASAWTRRGERLLDGRAETYAHGYLALIRSDLAKASGDIPRALGRDGEAVAIGERTGHQDLYAFALTAQAMLRIATGTIDEGIGLLEEAAIAAVNGELSPLPAGITAMPLRPLSSAAARARASAGSSRRSFWWGA